MGGEGLLEIDKTAVIVKKLNGKVGVSQETDIVENSQHVGHIAGLVTAALTGTLPFILAGTIAGELIGKLLDHDITNKFLEGAAKRTATTHICSGGLRTFGSPATSADHKAAGDFRSEDTRERSTTRTGAKIGVKNGRSCSGNQDRKVTR
jgi:hypothetical protein